jgi:hypothetical protein
MDTAQMILSPESGYAHRALEAARGAADATAVVQKLRSGQAQPDELLDAWRAQDRSPNWCRAQGFARQLEKLLTEAGAHG